MRVVLYDDKEIRCKRLTKGVNGHYMYTEDLIQIPVHLIKDIYEESVRNEEEDD